MARILVVDDSVYFRLKLREILTSAGHEIVAEAANGQSAVLKYKELRPDLVTMDISMPDTDGIMGVRKILEFDPKAKIVMVSAMGQKHMVFDALRAGAKHFIVKPVDNTATLDVIDKVLHVK